MLRVDGTAAGTYKLIGVLLYKSGAHYIADTWDGREKCFVRYDGYEPANGLGRRVQEPSPGRFKHVHGLGGWYFPVFVVYGRVS